MRRTKKLLSGGRRPKPARAGILLFTKTMEKRQEDLQAIGKNSGISPRAAADVILNGSDLTIEEFVAAARGRARVGLDGTVAKKLKRSSDVINRIVESRKPTYGVNTGFGEFSKVSIDGDAIEKLQENLILSHCTAVGDPYPAEVVRGMMVLRANSLCKGYSGVRPVIVRTLVDMLNAGVHPVVPEKGSLGASGDLAPLSHMVLPMLGYGEAEYKGVKMSGAEAMKGAGIALCRLTAKEGLALINGTQAMTSVGTLAYCDTLRAARLADIACSLTLEALMGLTDEFEECVHALRPHPGQSLVAKNIRNILKDSEILEHSKSLRVQDAYALRCAPQVHGAVRDALDYVRGVIEIELNSVTDNPLVFSESGKVLSAGNFHGEPMAVAFDVLGIAASEIASISERRLERLVNPALSEGLPAFLTRYGGLNSGYMICQYCAASMVSENKILAHPASVDSIPSSANQEDFVSMGTTAARKSARIVENTLSVLAFELMAAAQGVDYRKYKPSAICGEVCRLIRGRVPPLAEDREIRVDIGAMNELVRSGVLTDAVFGMYPDFR